ncbi:MAG: glycosyltransferase [Phycisphaerae bacterium]|nr:glycosyltransferase [Tepidisphaeraceae bacterium]
MNYCFLSCGSWKGNGTLQRIEELGAALVRQGVTVSYVLDDVPANRDEVRIDPGARRVYVSPASGWGQFRARAEAVRSTAPDFVHVMTPSPKAWLTMRRLPRVPVVGDWDEWPAIRPSYSWLRLRLVRHVDRWLRRRSVLRVVASRYMQRRFRDDFGQDSLYLPHGMFDRRFPPDGPSPFARPTAVYLGSLYPAYDHDILFDAMAMLKARGQAPDLLMITDGPEHERWARFVRDQGLDNVHMPGRMDGDVLAAHLRHAHVLLFPLRPSDINMCRCPGKAFFYAIAQRPVITTDVGEVPAVFGDRATYVDADAGAFADAISAAMAAPRQPDVTYDVGTWDDRARTLLGALAETGVGRAK